MCSLLPEAVSGFTMWRPGQGLICTVVVRPVRLSPSRETKRDHDPQTEKFTEKER